MNLDPPPSRIPLVDDISSDSIWKKWLNNLYQFNIFSGDFLEGVEVKTSESPYSVTGNDRLILCNPDTGDIFVNLPAGQNLRAYTIKNYATTITYDVKVTPDGSETIEDLPSYVLSKGEAILITYIESRAGWYIL